MCYCHYACGHRHRRQSDDCADAGLVRGQAAGSTSTAGLVAAVRAAQPASDSAASNHRHTLRTDTPKSAAAARTRHVGRLCARLIASNAATTLAHTSPGTQLVFVLSGSDIGPSAAARPPRAGRVRPRARCVPGCCRPGRARRRLRTSPGRGVDAGGQPGGRRAVLGRKTGGPPAGRSTPIGGGPPDSPRGGSNGSTELSESARPSGIRTSWWSSQTKRLSSRYRPPTARGKPLGRPMSHGRPVICLAPCHDPGGRMDS